MTSEELGEMFEGDSADICADPEARTPIGASGNFLYIVCSMPHCYKSLDSSVEEIIFLLQTLN